MHKSNEKLQRALEECLQGDFAFIPSDKEIKKQYTPSESFKKQMNVLINREKRKDKFKFIYQNRKRIYQLAAGAAIVILVINIGVQYLIPDMANDNLSNQIIESESSTEIADSYLNETAPDESVTQTIPKQSVEDSSLWDGAWTLLSISTNDAVFRLENTTEQSYSYSNISRVERYENDSWITVYDNQKLEDKIIEQGETIEETISLSDYNMKMNGIYRLYRNINQKHAVIEIEIPYGETDDGEVLE